jgi:endoglucanase
MHTADHIILTIHYYNPFHFTHQGAEWVSNSDSWLGTTWNDTQFERDAVFNDFGLVRYKAKSIPVHVGEYGSYNKSEMACVYRAQPAEDIAILILQFAGK